MRSTGAVEIAVVEFPGSKFKGEIVPAMIDLVESGIVTIIDLAFVTKDEDGTVIGAELDDLDDETVAAFDELDGEVNGLLSDEDLLAGRRGVVAGKFGDVGRVGEHVGPTPRHRGPRRRGTARRPRPARCRDGRRRDGGRAAPRTEQ